MAFFIKISKLYKKKAIGFLELCNLQGKHIKEETKNSKTVL